MFSKNCLRAICLAIFVILAIGPVFGLVSAELQQTTQSPWLKPDQPVLEKLADIPPGTAVPYSINGNRDCYQRKVITRPERVLPIWPFHQSEQSNESCVVSTAYGDVSTNGYLQHGGTKVSGRVTNRGGGTQYLIPAPLSSTSIHGAGGALDGVYLQFTREAGETIESSANVFGEVTHRFTVDPTDTLTDRSGRWLAAHTDSLSFSSNGMWMVVDIPNIGMARVDMRNFEVLPFGDPIRYNMGVAPGLQTAISPDGRYAAIFTRSFGRFKLYDLSTCAAVPERITSKVACESRNLLPFMQQQLPGFYGASRLRFKGNHTIELYASQKQGSTNTSGKYLLTAPGEQSQSGFDYLALGDSFASGEGAYQYKPGTDTSNNKCHLSTRSYPYLIGSKIGLSQFESAACSGAVILDIIGHEDYNRENAQAKGRSEESYDNEILGNFLPGYRAQKEFVSEYKPSVVTISTAGNDIGFADILTRCLMPDTCYPYYEDRKELVEYINSKFYDLTDMYNQVKNAGDPRMKVYVLGYPQLANPDGKCGVNVRLEHDELVFAQQLTTYLNAMIKRAAENAGVTYVDVENAFGGHRLCETADTNTAVNGLTIGDDKINVPIVNYDGPIGNESYHPNERGHQLYSAAILRETSNFTKTNPEPVNSVGPPQISDDLPLLQAPKTGRATRLIRSGIDMASETVYRARKFDVKTSALQTLSDAKAFLFSDPVDLGTYKADAKGNLSIEVTIPETVPTGFHTLHLYGKDISGEPIDIQKVIYVAASENDYDGDDTPNTDDPCLIIDPSGEDYDKDGTDDACDGQITEPPAPEPEPTPPPQGQIQGSENETPDVQGTTQFQQTTSPQPTASTTPVQLAVADEADSQSNQAIEQEGGHQTPEPQVAAASTTPEPESPNSNTSNAKGNNKNWLILLGLVSFLVGLLVAALKKYTK